MRDDDDARVFYNKKCMKRIHSKRADVSKNEENSTLTKNSRREQTFLKMKKIRLERATVTKEKTARKKKKRLHFSSSSSSSSSSTR